MPTCRRQQVSCRRRTPRIRPEHRSSSITERIRDLAGYIQALWQQGPDGVEFQRPRSLASPGWGQNKEASDDRRGSAIRGRDVDGPCRIWRERTGRGDRDPYLADLPGWPARLQDQASGQAALCRLLDPGAAARRLREGGRAQLQDCPRPLSGGAAHHPRGRRRVGLRRKRQTGRCGDRDGPLRSVEAARPNGSRWRTDACADDGCRAHDRALSSWRAGGPQGQRILEAGRHARHQRSRLCHQPCFRASRDKAIHPDVSHRPRPSLRVARPAGDGRQDPTMPRRPASA